MNHAYPRELASFVTEQRSCLGADRFNPTVGPADPLPDLSVLEYLLKDVLAIVISQDDTVRFIKWDDGAVIYWDQGSASYLTI